MIALLILISLSAVATYIFMQQPQFGRAPSGKRLQRVMKSPNYRDGSFQNLSKTPNITEGTNLAGALWKFLFSPVESKYPSRPFKFLKTDLKSLPANENAYIWMGHSSYYMQIDGKKILVDPVFSGNASPVTFTTKAFAGSDLYAAEDIPELDYLIISHDHWDHLDYETVTKLRPKVKRVITGLGTGEHLEYWGYNPDKIIELDWYESADLGSGYRIYAEPARHFSGRGLKRDQTIWASFLFETPTKKIYIGGDSGYDTHFRRIGEKFGRIDLAILETGQYNEDWRYIHMIPAQQIQAMKDLNAARMIPVHNSKFALALHSWYEPLDLITERNTENLRIITPEIGQKINWEDDGKVYQKWWEKYKN